MYGVETTLIDALFDVHSIKGVYIFRSLFAPLASAIDNALLYENKFTVSDILDSL